MAEQELEERGAILEFFRVAWERFEGGGVRPPGGEGSEP
jgi:hypothetical protein